MNVLIVTQYFWPEDFRINDLALGLRERGHAVQVLTGKPNYPGGGYFAGYSFWGKARDDFQGIAVHRVPLIVRGRGGGVRLAINYLSFALLAGMLGPFVCPGKTDVIFVYEPSPITVGIPALVLRRIKRAPVMFWMQDLWPESLSATGAVRSRAALHLVALMVRLLYKGFDRILVQAQSFLPAVRRLGAHPARTVYFPNSAEPLYRPVAVAPDAVERRLLPKGFLVTFAGNVGAAQDFETILAAAERLRGMADIRLVIIGSGRLLGWVVGQIRTRHLEGTVVLLGRHPVHAMPRFFALSDALLVTLKRDPIFAMTIPSKVQSYMACGRPIVAALDGEGARVISEAGAGLVCPAGSPRALADAIAALYRLPSGQRALMGENGRRYFMAHFEREKLLDRLDGWIASTRRNWLRRGGESSSAGILSGNPSKAKTWKKS